MKEIREILKEVAGLPEGEKAVLATVVDLKGSGYRLPGARMLIKANGDATGTVSGGCLEADVLERAKRVLATGKAEVFTYDTTADENSVFSLNMGCRGVLRILLEPVDDDSKIISLLHDVNENRKPLASATLIDTGGDANLTVGSRVLVDESNVGEIVDSQSLIKAIPQLHDELLTFTLSSAGYETIHYEAENGTTEFAFETLKPPVRLVIFGAGADAVPLANTANSLGWHVCIYDHRPAFLTEERFPVADELVELDRDSTPNLATDNQTAIVSMNHNYDRDKEMLCVALRSNAFYVGALGPKKRTLQILDELGNPFDESQLSRLRAPAGLDIGADTPEAIAISIIAEIQSVLKNRTGGPLRDRQASIYDRK